MRTIEGINVSNRHAKFKTFLRAQIGLTSHWFGGLLVRNFEQVDHRRTGTQTTGSIWSYLPQRIVDPIFL